MYFHENLKITDVTHVILESAAPSLATQSVDPGPATLTSPGLGTVPTSAPGGARRVLPGRRR